HFSIVTILYLNIQESKNAFMAFSYHFLSTRLQSILISRLKSEVSLKFTNISIFCQLKNTLPSNSLKLLGLKILTRAFLEPLWGIFLSNLYRYFKFIKLSNR